jgi:hypothetical protein
VRARAAALAREAARAEAGAGRRPSAWHDPARTLPRPLPAPGPGAWRASCWPA